MNMIKAMTVGAVLALAGTSVCAQTFTDVTSSFEDIRFDPATSEATEGFLVAGFHQGHNAFTGYREFRAGNADFGVGPAFALDTITFVVAAPPGRELQSLQVDVGGSYSVARLGRVGGGASLAVDGVAYPVGEFVSGALANNRSWGVDGLVDLSGKTSATVALTAAVFAWTVPTSGSVKIELTSAVFSATLVPLPEPDVAAAVEETVVVE